jgi:hypothetical protein
VKAVGTEVGFEFSLHRVSLSDPIERRTGRGVVLATDNYSVWPCPGYSVRVTESPDYPAGTVVSLSPMSVRP